ncbi:MAG TPA: hypothetical protein VFE47_30950 [Tepidisphaeraceae bacterium]|nr:hypothetical protein [Tepidisphaeraceae bacterium]
MSDEMDFVEGTYRLAEREWQVFIFGPDPLVVEPTIVTGKWPSGVSGVFVKWPPSKQLNKKAVLQVLSAQLAVSEWSEVRGPDSMHLR